MWDATASTNVRVTYGERGDDDEEAEPTAGVREPRKPVGPVNSAGAALEVPRAEDAPAATS